MRCPGCSHPHDTEALFCSRCGQALTDPLLDASLGTKNPARAASASSLIGRELGGYRVLELLGKGGMGTVYLAFQQRLQREVALKVLPMDFATDRERVQRFEREARSLARIRHRAIVDIYDIIEESGFLCIAMEHMAGGSLDQVLKRRGPLPEDQAARICRDVALGLQAASDKGVVHRDIKPGNLLLTSDGQVKIADFGLAGQRAGDASQQLTATGSVLGTPAYMPPEQWQGAAEADQRSDLYALGVSLFVLLTGKLPFPGPTMLQFMRQHCSKAPRSLKKSCPSTSQAMRRIVRRLLRKDPEKRFSGGRQLAEALEPLAASENLNLADEYELESSDLLPRSQAPRPPDATATPQEDPPAPSPAAKPTPPGAGAEAPVTERAPDRRPLIAVAALLGLGLVVWLLASLLTSTPLRLAELEPASGTLLRSNQLQLRGLLQTADGDRARVESVELAGQSWPVERDGSFRAELELEEGQNRFQLRAEGLEAMVSFDCDTSPRLEFLAPEENTAVGPLGVEVRLRATGLMLHRVEVDGKIALHEGGDIYTAKASPQASGQQRLLARCVDAEGREAFAALSVQVDRTPPHLAFVQPAEGAQLAEPEVVVKLSSADARQLSVNGRAAESVGGRWQVTLRLSEGPQELRVEALDALGNRAELRRNLTVDSQRPELRFLHPEDGAVLLAGRHRLLLRAEDTHLAGLKVQGIAAHESAGVFVADLDLGPGEHRLTAEAWDLAGNRRDREVQVRALGPFRVEIVEPRAGEWLKLPGTTLDVLLTVEGGTPSGVELNGVEAQRDGDVFRARLPLADEPAELRLAARVWDDAGREDSSACVVRVGSALLKEGGSAESEAAVQAALGWLARHQSVNGGWSADDWAFNCPHELCNGPSFAEPGNQGPGQGFAFWSVGVSGLALTAFVINGDTPHGGRYADTVRRAQDWLLDQQDAGTGAIGFVQEDGSSLYNHALATEALCELFARSSDIALREPVQRAIDFLVGAQNPGLGWGYGVMPGKNTTSLSGRALIALSAGRRAGLDVPESALDGGLAWLNRVTDSRGEAGYERPGDGSSFQVDLSEGRRKPYQAQPYNTALVLFCRLLAGVSARDGTVRDHARILKDAMPRWQDSYETVHFLYWHTASAGLFLFQRKPWHDFNEAVLEALLPHQRKDGCEAGSWDPIGEWAFSGGRVYATALNAQTLQVYTRGLTDD